MAPVAQAIRNQEILKTEYSEKAAIGALYDELSLKDRMYWQSIIKKMQKIKR